MHDKRWKENKPARNHLAEFQMRHTQHPAPQHYLHLVRSAEEFNKKRQKEKQQITIEDFDLPLNA